MALVIEAAFGMVIFIASGIIAVIESYIKLVLLRVFFAILLLLKALLLVVVVVVCFDASIYFLI